MKKILTLTLLSLLVGVSAQANFTIYVSTSAVNAYLYLWYGDSNNGWPGLDIKNQSTVTINGDSFYKVDVEGNVWHLIFNNGSGAQASDIYNISETRCYTYDGNKSVNDVTASYSHSLELELTAYWLVSDSWDWIPSGNVGVWTSNPKVYDNSSNADVTSLGERDGYYAYKWTGSFSVCVVDNLDNMKVQFNDITDTEWHKNSPSGLKYATDRFYKDYTPDGTEGILYSRTFSSTNGSTVCLPFALTTSEAAEYGKFYELKSADGNNVVFSSVEATEACVPYYFVPKAAGVTISSEGKTIEFDLTKMDVTVGNGNVTFSGTLAATSKSGVYGFQGGNLVYAADAVNIPEFRAYLTAATGAKLSLSFEDETGINTISRGNTDNVYYDLQGRRVMNPTKGLFIVNGKKVIK